MQRRPLVVFDLNGALCCTDYDGKTYPNLRCDFKVRRKNVYVRPYIHTMLAEVFAVYDVAVWTCNGSEYGESISRSLFGRYYGELQFVWTGDKCMGTGKDMKKNLDLIDTHQKIVLVDDTPEKKIGSGGLLVVKAFTPGGSTSLDDELLSVKTRIDSIIDNYGC